MLLCRMLYTPFLCRMITCCISTTLTHFYRNYLHRRGWRWGNRYDRPGSVILFHQCIADLTKTRQSSPAGSHGTRAGDAMTFAFCSQESFDYLQRNKYLHDSIYRHVISNLYILFHVRESIASSTIGATFRNPFKLIMLIIIYKVYLKSKFYFYSFLFIIILK